MFDNKYLVLALRIIVGGVFIWAGILKILDPLEFAQSIRNYRIFPQSISFFLALALPWVEVISGSLLILGIFHRSSALLISSLLVLFLVLVVITMARGLDVDCGCFGSLSRKVDFKLFVVDSFLCFGALLIFFSKDRSFLLVKDSLKP